MNKTILKSQFAAYEKNLAREIEFFSVEIRFLTVENFSTKAARNHEISHANIILNIKLSERN